MSAQAPNAKELKKEMKGLSKVKVKESSGGPSKEDRKPLEDIYKSHKGDFKKIKADSKFKGKLAGALLFLFLFLLFQVEPKIDSQLTLMLA